MGEGKEKGEDEECFVLLPAYSLLMPEAGDDAENGEAETDEMEGGLSFALVASSLQFAVLHSVSYVDVQPYQHPEHQSDPSVGRQENHHAEAGEYAEDRN